jgi:hypothetical protein
MWRAGSKAWESVILRLFWKVEIIFAVSLCLTIFSTDFLEALGASPAQNEQVVRQCIMECGFGYMHAPVFHPSMRHAAPVRKDLPFRTVFNLLGMQI